MRRIALSALCLIPILPMGCQRQSAATKQLYFRGIPWDITEQELRNRLPGVKLVKKSSSEEAVQYTLEELTHVNSTPTSVSYWITRSKFNGITINPLDTLRFKKKSHTEPATVEEAYNALFFALIQTYGPPTYTEGWMPTEFFKIGGNQLGQTSTDNQSFNATWLLQETKIYFSGLYSKRGGDYTIYINQRHRQYDASSLALFSPLSK